MCNTHSIIVVDQSGSMRSGDVPYFRSRSTAAYGLLALDYISRQLEERDENDGSIDVVTVIGMNDESSVLFDREPMDWILFNKILEMQETSRPYSHGNYCPAFRCVERIIKTEYNSAACAGMDIYDIPLYPVVFLSDGKPSDPKASAKKERNACVRSIARLVRSKLSLFCIGLGNCESDFGSLKGLVAVAKSEGAEATFEFSSLSASKMSDALSSLASSVTTTRCEMQNMQSDQTVSDQSIILRDADIPRSERDYRRFQQGVSRWRFSHIMFRNIAKQPWREIEMFNWKKEACGFEIETMPFAKGGERVAYSFFEIDADGNRLGNEMVAKRRIGKLSTPNSLKDYLNFCRAQGKARHLAKAFNQKVQHTPCLRPLDRGDRLPKLVFVNCDVYRYVNFNGQSDSILVERYLKGKFTKYNGNNSYVKKKKSATGSRRIQLHVGDAELEDFVQAFSHWTYLDSNRQLLVCDIQGVLNEEGRVPRFELTDPCICSKNSKARYGKTDVGMKGFRSFKHSHKCNNVCHGLGLPPL